MPSPFFLDVGSHHWRVGKVFSISGATATVKVLCEPGFIRSITVTTSDLPNQTKGAPLVARMDISGGGPSSYTIAEMRAAAWGSDAPFNESLSIDHNDPCWPVIPPDLLLYDMLLDGGGGGGASLIHQASRTLTNDEIIHLPSTAIQLVGAPPSDLCVVPTLGFLRVDSAFNAYTNIDPNAELFVASESGPGSQHLGLGVISNANASQLDNSFGGGNLRYLTLPVRFDWPLISGVIAELSTGIPGRIQGKPVLISISNGALGNFMGGDPANSCAVAMTFNVFDPTQGKFLTTTESGWNETTRTFS